MLGSGIGHGHETVDGRSDVSDIQVGAVERAPQRERAWVWGLPHTTMSDRRRQHLERWDPLWFQCLHGVGFTNEDSAQTL